MTDSDDYAGDLNHNLSFGKVMVYSEQTGGDASRRPIEYRVPAGCPTLRHFQNSMSRHRDFPGTTSSPASFGVAAETAKWNFKKLSAENVTRAFEVTFQEHNSKLAYAS